MVIWVGLCIASFVCLLVLLRKDQVSLGLPFAYLGTLLLIHVPGAFAQLVTDGFLSPADLTEVGIRLTAIGSICFVTGVALGRYRIPRMRTYRSANSHEFLLFCLIGGWVFTFVLSTVVHIASFSAVVEKGGAIWMLGTLLGLRSAVQKSNLKGTMFWLSALAVYPTLTLLLGGFLSYGSKAAIIVCSGLAISARGHWRLAGSLVVASFIGLTVFVNYFQSRDEIREVVWGGAPMMDRVAVVANVARNFHWFDPSDHADLVPLDERLNQNYFVGLAATRIQRGEADYLYGRSVWEGVLALVPRVFWPEKPVVAGSPRIVAEMTGLELSETTSWGVGNVMEFYINSGMLGLVIGFLGLGWLLGRLDLNAALAIDRGDFGSAVLFFLPAAALIEPNGSIVEMTSGAAAALIAAYGWRIAWKEWEDWTARTGAPSAGARKRPGSYAMHGKLGVARRKDKENDRTKDNL